MGSIEDKLEEWKTQLGQAEEYDLLFDTHIVAEMLSIIEELEKDKNYWKGKYFSNLDKKLR